MSKIFYNCFKAGFKVGLMAGVLNVVWFLAARFIFRIDYTMIKWHFVLTATLLSCMLAGVIYYFLYSLTIHHRIVFIIGAITVLLCSLYFPLEPILPGGSPTTRSFQALTIPMHFIAGLMATFYIPSWTHLNDRSKA